MRLPPLVRRYGDLVLAVVLAGGYAVQLAGLRTPGSWLAVPVGALTTLALAGRRRHPVTTYGVVYLGLVVVGGYLAPGAESGAPVFLLVLLLGLYSLGACARGGEVWWGVGFVLATVVTLDLQDGDHSPSGVFFFVVVCGLPWAAGLMVRLRAERLAELRRRNAEIEEQTRAAVAEERARLARELHDVVSHAIAVTVLQARGGSRLLGRDDEGVRGALTAIEQTHTAALADMRRLLRLLRTADGEDAEEPAPGLGALPALLDQVRSSGLSVVLTTRGDPLPVPPGVDRSAYRIVQEALTNVLKHAGPDAVAAVEVAYGRTEVVLKVVDVGAGPPSGTRRSAACRVAVAAPGTGHGLVGIRERAAATGGTVEAGATGDGFAVRARLPYLRAESLAGL